MAEPITLAEAKLHLRVLSNDEDLYIEGLIPPARRYIELRSGITINQRQFIESQFPAYGVIRLDKGPLVSIDEIAYTDEVGGALTYDGARFFPGSSVILPAIGESWPTLGVSETFQITYTAGLSPAELATDDYDNLTHAMKLLVGHWYANRESVVEGDYREVPLAVNALCDQVRMPVL